MAGRDWPKAHLRAELLLHVIDWGGLYAGLKEECATDEKREKVGWCRLLSLGLTWQFLHHRCNLRHRWGKKCHAFVWTNIKPWFQTFSEWYASSHCVLPVAQRAIKVWTCLRISVSLSSGSGSLLIMCSMKSFGVTAAKFHFNFPNTTSSHSWREIDKEPWQRMSENWEWQRTRKIKWHKARPHIFILCHFTVKCT